MGEHHSEADEYPVYQQDSFVRWIPVVVPLFALLILVSAFLIEADVL